MTIRAVDVLSAAIVPIYDSLGDSAVEYIIKHSELSVALVEASKLPLFAQVAAAVAGQVKTVVSLSQPKDGPEKEAMAAIVGAGIEVTTWEEYLEVGAASPVEPMPPTAEDLACIMYTSGTTGTPKVGMLNRYRYIHLFIYIW